MNTRQERIRMQASRLTANDDGFESLEDPRASMLGWVERATASDEEKDRARQALRKLAHQADLNELEMDAFEAIVYPEGRPVVDIVDDSFGPLVDPWLHLGEAAFRSRIEAAIPALGRIEIPEHPQLPYAGTGFLVGDGLIMTNRHVAELFARGLGRRQLAFRSGLGIVEIDFKREILPTPPRPFRIVEILMIHPYWDMALLRVEGIEGRTPLTLAALPPESLAGRDVVVIGYPAQDLRNDVALQHRIFRKVFQVKRLQPGKVVAPSQTRSFGRVVTALGHDSSTLGGNSGSAVVDVATGHVLGLHFGGRFLEMNFGVPAFELKRDGRVVDAGVSFTADAVPPSAPWFDTWRPLESVAGPVESDRAEPSVPVTNGHNRSALPAVTVAPPGTVQLTIPLQITISLGAVEAGSHRPGLQATLSAGDGDGGSDATARAAVVVGTG